MEGYQNHKWFEITDEAKNQIEKLLEKNPGKYAVSLAVLGGGCAGFEYEWTIIESKDDLERGDIVIDSNTGKFVVGAVAVMYMIGTEVNYKKDIIGSMFEVNNPNAESACGCGVSVNFDVDKLDNSLAVEI